jgi:hypothetical protein
LLIRRGGCDHLHGGIEPKALVRHVYSAETGEDGCGGQIDYLNNLKQIVMERKYQSWLEHGEGNQYVKKSGSTMRLVAGDQDGNTAQ